MFFLDSSLRLVQRGKIIAHSIYLQVTATLIPTPTTILHRITMHFITLHYTAPHLTLPQLTAPTFITSLCTVGCDQTWWVSHWVQCSTRPPTGSCRAVGHSTTWEIQICTQTQIYQPIQIHGQRQKHIHTNTVQGSRAHFSENGHPSCSRRY